MKHIAILGNRVRFVSRHGCRVDFLRIPVGDLAGIAGRQIEILLIDDDGVFPSQWNLSKVFIGFDVLHPDTQVPKLLSVKRVIPADFISQVRLQATKRTIKLLLWTDAVKRNFVLEYVESA